MSAFLSLIKGHSRQLLAQDSLLAVLLTFTHEADI